MGAAGRGGQVRESGFRGGGHDVADEPDARAASWGEISRGRDERSTTA
jgi:hypothetical protein